MLKAMFLYILYSFFMEGDVSHTQAKMGTFASITLPQKSQHQIDAGFLYLDDLEHILSSYQEDALLYRLNHDKHSTSNPHLKAILQKSIDYYHDTHGYFDISVGSITKNLYHFGEKETIPSAKSLQNAPLGLENIELNTSTIMIDANTTLDLGGIARGYAIDTLADYYHDNGISRGRISLGADIRCLTPCKIHIASPLSNNIFATLKATTPDLSISTSQIHSRYIHNKKNNHLINPKTKSPQTEIRSLTLFTKANNAKVDAYATAVSTMPKEQALDFLTSHKEIGYIVVDKDYKVHTGQLEGLVNMLKLMNLEKEYKLRKDLPSYSNTQRLLMKISGTETSSPR